MSESLASVHHEKNVWAHGGGRRLWGIYTGLTAPLWDKLSPTSRRQEAARVNTLLHRLLTAIVLGGDPTDQRTIFVSPEVRKTF